MSFLESLIKENRISLYHDYRSGSARDFSGNDFHGTSTDIRFYRDYYRTSNAGTGRPDISAHYADSKLVFDDELTIIAMPVQIGWTHTSGSNSSDDVYIQRNDASSVNYQFNFDVSAGDLVFYTGTVSYGSIDSIDAQASYPFLSSVGITTKKGQLVNFYTNGINFSTSTSSIPLTIDTTADSLLIGTSRGYGAHTGAGLKSIIVAMEQFTEKEMALIHSDLLSTKWPRKTNGYSQRKTFSIPTEDTLIGSWDMSPVGNKVIDKSANFNHGEIVYDIHSTDSALGSALFFDNTASSRLTIGNDSDYNLASGDLTYQIIFKQHGAGSHNPAGLVCIYYNASNFFWLWQHTDGTFEIYSDESGGGNASLLSTTEAPQYDTWNHIVLTKTQAGFKLYLNSELVGDVTHSFNHTSTSSYYVYLASDQSGRSWNGEIADFQMYSEEKDSDWVDKQYKEFAKTVQFKTDWSAGESGDHITDGFIGNTKMQVDAGAWKIQTEEVNGKLCKVLTSTSTTEIVYIPVSEFMCTETEAAFGTWDFWIYKETTDNYTFHFGSAIEPITVGNYRVQVYNDEHVALIECNIAVMDTTAINTVTVDTWQNIKITRDHNGEFKVYLDGTLILNDTDITNTTAAYIGVGMYSGSKICLGAVDGSQAITKYLGVV